MSIQMWFRTKWARTVCFFERVLFVPIPRRPADPQFLPGHTFLDPLNNLRCNLFRAAFCVAWLLPGYCFACNGTLLDHLTFELRKAQHDMEDQTAVRSVVNQPLVEDVYGYILIK